jgi:probable HAF family extracellular repeat protein
VGHYIPDPSVPGVSRAFLYDDGAMIDLGTLRDLPDCRAWDINEAGQIVGSCDCDSCGISAQAFLWEDGAMTVLAEHISPEFFVHSVNPAWAINAVGQMLVGSVGDHDAVLTPIPPAATDINGDCRTDVDDLLILIYEWAANGSQADIDGDGDVDVDDLLQILMNWN